MKLKNWSDLLFKGRLPGQLVVQLTDRCNATCPQCGMNRNQPFKRHRLALDEVKRIIDAAADRGIQALSFTGGEPLLRLPSLVTLINHAGAAGIPYIRTGTNGFSFRDSEKADYADRIHRLAETLAGTPLRNFWISIDSADPRTHETMRGFPGVIRGIARAIPIFHVHGIYPSVNLGINRNLDGRHSIPCLDPLPATGARVPEEVFRERLHAGFSRFFRFAAELGFSIANVCYPMSVDAEDSEARLNAVYGATASASIVSFSAREKAHLFDVLGRAVLENRARLRIFTPLCALHALKRQFRDAVSGYPCRGGQEFLFIDAVKGHAYPCGYRGDEDLGPFKAQRKRREAALQDCCACEWECFRDPSALGGPLREIRLRPRALRQRWKTDRAFFACWSKDLRYYMACDFFDGRRPMRPERLAHHQAVDPAGETTE